MIAQIVGFEGQIQWDSSKPDGTPRKLLDTTKINSLGWKPAISLRDGIERTYRWSLSHDQG
jgi:GDP-L-fucose synthase